MTMMRTDLELRVGFLAWLKKRVEAEYRKAHDELASTMRRGAKLPAVTADDRTIATCSMSSPEREAVITDRAALTDWYARHYPDHVEERHTVSGSTDEVVAVLREYAPHLVSTETVLRPWALSELCEVAKAEKAVVGPGGEMDLPGVEMQRPNGRLTVRLTDEADDAMASLVDRLTLDGHLKAVTDGR